MRFLLAFTVGLLGFLGDRGRCSRAPSSPATGAAGARRRARSSGSGAAGAYLALAGVDAWLRDRRGRRGDGRGASATAPPSWSRSASGCTTSARGSRSAPPTRSGSLALGAALVVGFALHNTTEGLAIVAPVARGAAAASRTLVLLGLLAGAPAVLGAWIGASAFNPSLAALMFGVGAGAIAQVIVQIAPAIRDGAGRAAPPARRRRAARRPRA